MNKCKDCYWYSDASTRSCDHEYEPANPEDEACEFFEEKEEVTQ